MLYVPTVVQSHSVRAKGRKRKGIGSHPRRPGSPLFSRILPTHRFHPFRFRLRPFRPSNFLPRSLSSTIRVSLLSTNPSLR